MKGTAVLWALALMATMALLPSPAAAQRHHHVTLWGADYVDLGHLGVHTHENKIGFGLWRIYMPRATNVRFVAHCGMWTYSWPYGPIENWRVEQQGSMAVVYVPTQFADLVNSAWVYAPWLAWQYWQTWNYWLDVDWDGP